MSETLPSQLSTFDVNDAPEGWNSIDLAASLLADKISLEHIAGSDDDRIALAMDLERIYNSFAPYVSQEARPYLIASIEAPIAAKSTLLIRNEIELGRVTNNLVEKIRGVPVGLNVLAEDLNDFLGDALAAQKNAIGMKSRSEKADAKYQADVLSSVAANYGLNIPASIVDAESGKSFKVDQVNQLLRQISQLRDKETRRIEREALGVFVSVGYAKQLKDFESLSGRAVSQLSQLFENNAQKMSKTIAAAALLGVAGPTLSATVAHAAPSVVNDDKRNDPSGLSYKTKAKSVEETLPNKVGQQKNNKPVVLAEKTVNEHQEITPSAEEKRDTIPKIVATAERRQETTAPKPTAPAVRVKKDGQSVVVAAPSERTVPEKAPETTTIKIDKDGHSVIVAKPDESRREKTGIIKIPAPAHAPAPTPDTPAPAPTPAPESPVPAPEVATEQQQFSLAAQRLIDRGGEWKNRGIVMKIFIDSGEMKPMHAAAFVGNFMVEAPNLDPATHQGWGGPGRGIGQWGNDRKPEYDRFGYDGSRGLVQFAKERGTSWDNLETQAYFVLHELRTTEKGAFAKIMATTTREEATMAVSVFYERPGEPHNPRRIESANIVAAGYNEELKAIKPVPARAAPEITTISQQEKEGMVGDIPYAYQLDPRWANMPLPDGTGPIGPVACNPTSLSMVAMAIGDKSATPDKVYARYNAENRIGKDGAHQQSILDLAPAYGLRANLIPNNDIEVFKKVIKEGGKIILSGNTNSRLLPNPGHFVVIYGISESGNMLVADPGFPENNGKEFSLQDQINASNSIRTRLGTTNAGLHYSAVALYAQ